jgi:MFS family permease
MSALEEYFSWRTAMLTIGVVDLAAAIAFVVLLPPSRRFVKRTDLKLRHHLQLWSAQLRHPRLPFVFAIGFLVMGAFVTVYNYVGFRLIAPPFDLSATACGLIFTAYLFGMVSSSSAGALADRVGRAPVLVSGILVFAAGLALTLSPSLVAIIVGIVLITIGFFVAHAVASGWVGHLAGASKGMRRRCTCSPITSDRACSARSAARSGNTARGARSSLMWRFCCCWAWPPRAGSCARNRRAEVGRCRSARVRCSAHDMPALRGASHVL